ncbi:ATP-binding cassette sub-family C member 2-like [Haemaphysalis longicornis]
MADALKPAEVGSFLLKCSALVVLVLFGGPETLPNNYPPTSSGPYWTLLDVAHAALLMASAVLAGTKGVFCVSSSQLAACVLTEATSDFAMALSLILVLLLLARRRQHCLPPSGFAVTLLGLLTTACVLDVFCQLAALFTIQDTLSLTTNMDDKTLIVSLVLVATLGANFIASEIQDLVLERTEETKNEDTRSLLGRQACTALYPLLNEAFRKGTSAGAPLPVLRRGMRCKRLIETVTARLQPPSHFRGKRRKFLLTMLKVLWVDVVRIALSTAAYFACIFARVPALELLLSTSNGVSVATAVLLFSATSAMELLVSCYQIDIINTFGCRARSMFLGVVFKKVTTMSAGSKARYPAGQITSMLGVDCSTVYSAAFCVPTPLFGALFLPMVFWMLAARAGVGPALCCAAWLLLVLSLPFLTSRLQKHMWTQAMRAREGRLRATADLLSAIRVVKMYAWEDAMQKNVLCARETELKWLRRINLLDGILDSIYSSTSSVLMIILFSTLPRLQPDIALTPALSFSCVALLYMTDLTMNDCGQAIRFFSQVSLALRRIADFCTAEEQPEQKEHCKTLLHFRKGAVEMRNCSFSWAQPEHEKVKVQLFNVNLDIEPGTLVGVVGFVGSGKSSLLSAILGDMHLIQGSATCTGSVAFVPQLPNVHNMTLRDNILYGKPRDSARYERVIRSCQLMNDINKLPSGDMTELGEKGTNLSGGQKQRISLARAAYSQSNVYLLDDPLSALDPVVGSRVFREVIGPEGLLKDRTRIMVCNQGNYLRHMNRLVVVDGESVKVYDKLQDLLGDPKTPLNLRQALDDRSLQLFSKAGACIQEMEENDEVQRITEEEINGSTKSRWEVVRSLLRLARWPVAVAVLAFVVAACAVAMEQLIVKQWTDATVASAEAGSPPHQSPWTQALVTICALDVASRILGSVMLSLTAQGVSRTLHRDMLNHVLRSPVSFFDGSPRGRILNRFSADIEVMDARSYLSGKQSVQNALIVLAKVVVIGMQSPIVVGMTAVVTALAAFAMDLTAKVSYHARYSESLAMSRLLQHATETVDALSSVRAYGVADHFRRHFWRLCDRVTRGYSCFGTAYCFARSLSAVAGFVVVLCTLLANTVFTGHEELDPSGLGLALSSATSVPMSLATLSVILLNILQMVVSFERCLDYTELPPEVDVTVECRNEGAQQSPKSLSKWPSRGEILFQDYSASYRPGVLPNVLSAVTFAVGPTEKIGVVGRTGAGKSSLVLALLRMLRASQGHILIDGVDIASVPLRVLRRKITVIPQDPCLVRGTLRMNLDPTNSHSDREIWQALERAHLAKMVANDARGLLLETSDGGCNLSVGQRQLVCLARALLRAPRVLLLDEATSQMDGDTDQLIQLALREAFGHCTLFTIAHRLHTVLDYDRILVLEDGRVREFDSVARLLANPSSAFYSMALEAGISNNRAMSDQICTKL